MKEYAQKKEKSILQDCLEAKLGCARGQKVLWRILGHFDSLYRWRWGLIALESTGLV